MNSLENSSVLRCPIIDVIKSIVMNINIKCSYKYTLLLCCILNIELTYIHNSTNISELVNI